MIGSEDSASTAVVARRLKATREALDLTAADLCREVGFTSSRYSQYETGERRLSLEAGLVLCRRFGLTLDWLFRGDLSGLPHRIAQRLLGFAGDDGPAPLAPVAQLAENGQSQYQPRAGKKRKNSRARTRAIVVSIILATGLAAPAAAADEPQTIPFRDAVLDGRALAAASAHVRIWGSYVGNGDTAEFLYAPRADLLRAQDSIRLLTEESPREVRKLLYDCRRQQNLLSRNSICPMWVVGKYGDCEILINHAVVPCVYVDEIEVVTPSGKHFRAPPLPPPAPPAE